MLKRVMAKKILKGLMVFFMVVGLGFFIVGCGDESVSSGGGGSSCPTASELGCCEISGGVQTTGVLVPSYCDCPPGTSYAGYDANYDMKQCWCCACSDKC